MGTNHEFDPSFLYTSLEKYLDALLQTAIQTRFAHTLNSRMCYEVPFVSKLLFLDQA